MNVRSLCGRTHKVILDGESRDACSGLFNVLHGTVLGPICFILFLNDLRKNLSSLSNLKVFADDSLLFREINAIDFAEDLKKDLPSLEKWTEDLHMRIHP